MRALRKGWVLALAVGCCCEYVQAQSLRELFVTGLTADPALAASEAQLRATEQRLRQARASVLPSLEATASNSDSRFYPDEGAADVREFHSARWAVQLSQPVFRPDALAGIDAAQMQLESARAQLDAAADDLASRLALAYFEVLGAREVLLSLTREKDASIIQLAAARRSYDKGTVAVTEVLDAEAKHDITAAQKDAAENDVISRREAFRQLIGGNEFELQILPRNAPDPAPVTETLLLLTDEALERNPVAQQARLTWEASKLGVRQARRGHLPKLDFVLSYGSDQSTGSPSNPQPVHGNTTQAQASLSLPLFAGFATSAKVGEAQALQDKSQADLENAERGVATNLREAYFGLKSALGQVASLKTAERSTGIAVRAQRKGYSVGTTTTAEVLKAETLFAQARRDLMKAKLDARLNRLRLQIALGRPWRETIDELSGMLVPESLAKADEPAVDADFVVPRRQDPQR